MTKTNISFDDISISVESDNTSYTDFGDIPSIVNSIQTMDPYISSDYHLLRWVVKPNEEKESKQRFIDVVMAHNSTVGDDDVCLLLGDMGESEFAEDQCAFMIDDFEKVLSILKGKKILVRGNNDTLPDEFYKRAGFIYICDVMKSDKFVFSHKPMDVTGDTINVHGHLHGNKQYWDIDYKRHIDVYWDMNGKKPNRLSQYLKWYAEGKYTQNAATVLSDEYRIADHV